MKAMRAVCLLPFLAGCGDGDQGFVDTFSVNDTMTSAMAADEEVLPADGYYLYVVSTGVSAAHIDLNGTRMLKPSDFKNRDFERSFDVSLEEEGDNSIEVSLRGSPGDQLCVRVYEIDSSNEEEPERTIYERCVDREAGPPNVASDGF